MDGDTCLKCGQTEPVQNEIDSINAEESSINGEVEENIRQNITAFVFNGHVMSVLV